MTLVIATATPFHGHVQPVLTVTADLVRRGHEVVVLTGSRFAEQVKAVGALHVSLPSAADFEDRKLELYFPERAALPAGPARIDYDMKYIFGDPTAAQYGADVRNAGRPVVVVTQGSFDNRDLGRLVRPTLEALAEEDVLVVAATGRPEGPAEIEAAGPVPPNARLAGYVPFDLLLPHASALVTNGGYGGVHQALQHGVPSSWAATARTSRRSRHGWSGAGSASTCGAGIRRRRMCARR